MLPLAASRWRSWSGRTPHHSRRPPQILGVDPGTIVKSLVVKRHDGSFLFALIPGDRQISWAKLRAVVGVNKLQLPDAEQALAATGYGRGTITPLGIDDRLAGVRRRADRGPPHRDGSGRARAERMGRRQPTHPGLRRDRRRHLSVIDSGRWARLGPNCPHSVRLGTLRPES